MSEAMVFIGVILSGLVAWFVMTRTKPVRYRKKPVLTGSELEFFHRLQEALPECRVCTKVAVTALIEPTGIGKMRRAAMAAIGDKRVGYAVFDEGMQLLAVVELDHRSRLTRAEATRDACFASAGIRTIRFPAQRIPSEAKIRSSIFARLSNSRQNALASTLQRDKDIEFRKTPWRNTLNAHF